MFCSSMDIDIINKHDDHVLFYCYKTPFSTFFFFFVVFGIVSCNSDQLVTHSSTGLGSIEISRAITITFMPSEPSKASSEIDNHQDNDDHNGNHILYNGADIATECHLATLPGIFILSSIVVIRGLCGWREPLSLNISHLIHSSHRVTGHYEPGSHCNQSESLFASHKLSYN